MENILEFTNIDRFIQTISDAIADGTTEQVVKKNDKLKKPWMSSEILGILEQRNKLYRLKKCYP